MSSPAGLWETLLSAVSRTAPPPVTSVELILAIVAAAALSVPRRSWKYFGLLTTAAHELGHAFAAVTSGQRLSAIHLRLDHSGTTTTYSRSKAATVWSCFWGYPVPAVMGAAFVLCGFHGWGSASIAAGAAALASTLVFLRNPAGFLITAAAIAGALALLLLVPGGFIGHVAVALGLALLVGAVRDLVKLVHVHLRRRSRLATSDAYILYRATSVPSGIWIFLFMTAVGGAWALAIQPVAAVLSAGA
ncbi:M50 family metallopeptidase [Pseudarthrobacter enclensis]|uniref:M50 family metallopeptidase n=1 Tax=Pseudarthrobacter enclensis TaxID=993070 RepID=UPI0034324D30